MQFVFKFKKINKIRNMKITVGRKKKRDKIHALNSPYKLFASKIQINYTI